jgi:thiamine-phosphate pyrophosphorylase
LILAVTYFFLVSMELPLAVDFKLYLITDRTQTKLPLPEAVHLALKGGVPAVQLREKDLPVRELLALAQELRVITREFGAKLFINDHVDVAVAVEADGVHLGHQSMPVDAARKIVGSSMLIGASTHSVQEAKDAEARGADFITYGPIFETPSKAHYGAPLGKSTIREVKYPINIPLFALGGIKSTNVLQVIAAGADGVALISAILAADDITAAAKKFMQAIDFMDRIACDYCTPR